MHLTNHPLPITEIVITEIWEALHEATGIQSCLRADRPIPYILQHPQTLKTGAPCSALSRIPKSRISWTPILAQCMIGVTVPFHRVRSLSALLSDAAGASGSGCLPQRDAEQCGQL